MTTQQQLRQLQKKAAEVGIHKADLEGVNDEYLSVSVLFGERAPAVKPTITYEEGDKIDIGDGEYLKVIHTPGHSKGSICLYEPVFKESLFRGYRISRRRVWENGF